MPDIKVLIINESTTKSIISDIFTFGCIIVTFFVNYHYLGNSSILQVFFGVMALVFVCAKGDRKIKKMSSKEALEYLSKTYGTEGEGIDHD